MFNPCGACDALRAARAADGLRREYVPAHRQRDGGDDDDGHAHYVHAYGCDDPHRDAHNVDPTRLPVLEVLD